MVTELTSSRRVNNVEDEVLSLIMPIDFERQMFFWSRVTKSGDHLIWTGADTTRGYGRMQINGRIEYSYRVSYCIANNLDIKDIEGVRIIKICDRTDCVAPEHLIKKQKGA